MTKFQNHKNKFRTKIKLFYSENYSSWTIYQFFNETKKKILKWNLYLPLNKEGPVNPESYKMCQFWQMRWS